MINGPLHKNVATPRMADNVTDVYFFKSVQLRYWQGRIANDARCRFGYYQQKQYSSTAFM